MAAHLTVRIRKRLPSGFQLESDLSLPLADSPVTILFGPSGSGKTTLLRLIAGLEVPDSGLIEFSGTHWYDSATAVCLPPQSRRTGFLFQDYALFPHLTIEENVAYAANRAKARLLLTRFGISDLAGRYPRAISGGQQQRVALARALAAGPQLLLLDEPLSALDAATRTRLRHDLRRILIESGVPAIVVTHDRREAIALGDHIAVLIEGKVRQTGPIQSVFRQPADAQVAQSVGVENVLAGQIGARDAGLVTVRVGPYEIQCPDPDLADGPVSVCIRAEDITLTRDPGNSSARNRLHAHVRAVHLDPPLARVELDCGFPLIAVVTAQSVADLQIQVGEEIWAVIKATSVNLVP